MSSLEVSKRTMVLRTVHVIVLPAEAPRVRPQSPPVAAVRAPPLATAALSSGVQGGRVQVRRNFMQDLRRLGSVNR